MANPTSPGTVPDVTTTLANFTTELNNILNGLQTQINTDASNESAALTDFITAEEKLQAASTAFGGPSPSFVAPIWKIPSSSKSKGTSDPSQSSNSAKNYYTAFYPLIKKTLQIQTAQQMEATEALAQIKEQLENIFEIQFNVQFPTPLTAKPENGDVLEWVQDSVLTASSVLNLISQEGIINALGQAVLTGTSLPTTKFDFPTYWAWALKIITTYYNKENPGVDYDKKTRNILTLLHSTWGKYQANNEASMLEWIQTTITNASSSLGLTNLQKEDIIGVLEDEILKLFPQPDKSFFYENIQNLLFKYIYNPPSNASNKEVAPAEFMLSIKSTTNTSATANNGAITALAVGGSGTYTFTLTGTPAKTQTPAWQAPIPNSTGIFTKLPPGIYQVSVNDGTTSDVPPNPITVVISGNSFSAKIAAKPTTPSIPGGSDVVLTATPSITTGTNTFVWTNLNTGLQILGANTGTVSNIGAGLYGVQVTNTPTPPKTPNPPPPTVSVAYNFISVENPKPQKNQTGQTSQSSSKNNGISNRGIKYYLEQLRNSKNPITANDVSSLESNIQNIIKIGIANTFNQMAEYGSQGLLFSSTYDCQIISRISDYTTALLNELNTDYDKLIPAANKQALTAAQDITSAAVSIERFSIALPDIKRAFDDEFNSDKVGSGGATLGSSYDQIKNYVESTSSSPNSLSSLDGISNALYSGSSSHVSLVQEAELKGVQLASKAAGLNTSLSNLLTTEQTEALKALSNLKLKAESNLKNAVSAYSKDSTSYFTELDAYITSKQNWEYDQLKQNAVQSALGTLNTVVLTGDSKAGQFSSDPYYKKPS